MGYRYRFHLKKESKIAINEKMKAIPPSKNPANKGDRV